MVLAFGLVLITGAQSVYATDVPFQTSAKGISSGYQRETTIVIRDNTTWNALWKNLTATDAPPTIPPTPDFNTRMAVAAMMGPQPTCSNSIYISGISLQDGVLHINVTKVFGPDGEFPCPTDVSPYHVVTLQRFDGPSTVLHLTAGSPTGSTTPASLLSISLLALAPATVVVGYILLRRARNR